MDRTSDNGAPRPDEAPIQRPGQARAAYGQVVRQTEFWDRMTGQFGAGYVDSVSRDQVISNLGNRTVHEALAAGEEPKVIWRAVCVHFEVPLRER